MKILCVIAMIALAGCAARHTAVGAEPIAPPALDEAWVKSAETTHTCVGWNVEVEDAQQHPGIYSDFARQYLTTRQKECENLQKQVEQARVLKLAAWAILEACNRQPVRDCEVPSREWIARETEWGRLNDKYRGIIRYSCADGWTLLGETCWHLRGKEMAETLRDGAVCHPPMAGSDWCLCEKPASK